MREQKCYSIYKNTLLGRKNNSPLPPQYYSHHNQRRNQGTKARKYKCWAVSYSIIPSLGNNLNTVIKILKNESSISEPHCYLGEKGDTI